MDTEWPFYPHRNTPKGWNRSSRIVMGLVGIYSKVWGEWLNRIETYNKDVLLKAVERPNGTPLITFSNHRSCLDDPVLWGVLKLSFLTCNNQRLRWTLAASDIVFTKEWHSRFFSRGRCVPVVRGQGVYQRSMDFMLEKLNAGEWVHTFPEGKVNENNEVIRLKWGMDNILPNRYPYIPRIGQKATLVVGDPMDLSDMISTLKESRASPMEMRKVLTDTVQDKFYKLKEKAEIIHKQKTH